MRETRHYVRFTPEEDRILLEMYGKIGLRLLSRRMSRCPASLIYRAQLLRKWGYALGDYTKRKFDIRTAPAQVQPGICLVHNASGSKYIAMSKPEPVGDRLFVWVFPVESFAGAVKQYPVSRVALTRITLVSEWEKYYGRHLG